MHTMICLSFMAMVLSSLGQQFALDGESTVHGHNLPVINPRPFEVAPGFPFRGPYVWDGLGYRYYIPSRTLPESPNEQGTQPNDQLASLEDTTRHSFEVQSGTHIHGHNPPVINPQPFEVSPSFPFRGPYVWDGLGFRYYTRAPRRMDNGDDEGAVAWW